jgi:type II secretory pathway pseudopilin PulG
MNHSTVMKGLAAAVTVVVVASLIGAAFVLESPLKQRQRRLDNQRLKDLWRIDHSIQRYAKNHDALPQNLAALEEEEKTDAEISRPPSDPETRAPYEYEVLDAQSFQLCAVFSLPSNDKFNRPNYGGWGRPHTDGKQCFKYTRKVDTK